VFSRGVGGETQNHETEAEPVKIGWGNTAEVVPGCFSNISKNTNTTSMMRRE
jgi:hypothetical protein